MRIAMIMDAWDPILGGGQVHVKNLVRELVERHGCEVDLFVRALKDEDGSEYTKDERFLNGKFRVIRCGRPKPFFFLSERLLSIPSMVRRIVVEHRKAPYDLIHAHAFLGLLVGKAVSVVLWLPIVGTVHGANLLDKGQKTPFYFVEKWLLTGIRYDAEITVGSSFLKYSNVNRPVVIPNGVRVGDFDRVQAERDRGFSVLFVGRFEWTKGIDILIESVRLLRDSDVGTLRKRGVVFRLAGYGYSEAEYRKMIVTHGLSEFFEFL